MFSIMHNKENWLLTYCLTCLYRTAGEGSLCDYNNKRHGNRHLTHIHALSDPADTCPPKTGYSFPRKLIEHDFFSTHQDFVQPKDPVKTRRTGYNKGHIRSLLDFDTFGFDHSAKVTRQREEGVIPTSPNSDRYSQSSRSRSPSPHGSPTSKGGKSRGTGVDVGSASLVSLSLSSLKGGSGSRSLSMLGTRLEGGVRARAGNLPEVVVPLHFNQSHKIYDTLPSSSSFNQQSVAGTGTGTDSGVQVKPFSDSHTKSIAWSLDRKEKLNVNVKFFFDTMLFHVFLLL